MTPSFISVTALGFSVLSFPKVRKGSKIIKHLLCTWYYVRHSSVLAMRPEGLYNYGYYSTRSRLVVPADLF